VDRFTASLKLLRVDFEKEEADVRSDLWHIKVDLIFAEIDKKDSSEKTVDSDILRYWLEEGTELELTKEAKYERLSDLVDDIDEVIKVMRNCSTEQ
jgi:PHP family Zn ribbon phosphoesterase